MWSGNVAPRMLTSILNGSVSLTFPSLYFRRNILRHHLTRRMYEDQSLSEHSGENMKSLLWRRIEPWSSTSKPGRHAVIFSRVHKLMWRHINGMAAQAVTVLTWSWETIGLNSGWGNDYPEFLLGFGLYCITKLQPSVWGRGTWGLNIRSRSVVFVNVSASSSNQPGNFTSLNAPRTLSHWLSICLWHWWMIAFLTIFSFPFDLWRDTYYIA